MKPKSKHKKLKFVTIDLQEPSNHRERPRSPSPLLNTMTSTTKRKKMSKKKHHQLFHLLFQHELKRKLDQLLRTLRIKESSTSLNRLLLLKTSLTGPERTVRTRKKE